MRTQCFLVVFLIFLILDRCFAKIICIFGASDVIEESPAIFGLLSQSGFAAETLPRAWPEKGIAF